MPAKNMSAMQLVGMKRQFLPTSDIFATMPARRFFPAQNPVQVSAISAGVPSKGGLTTLAFNCDSQQINNVIIVKYECGPAQSARESEGTSFVIRLGHGLSHILIEQERGDDKATHHTD